MLMLGMYIAPNVNNKYQVKYMDKKATAWAISIIVGNVQQKIMKSLKLNNPPNNEIPLILHYTKQERI